ncbi:MAG: gyrB, partial [Verrucomicrobiales bacterium]|nr:gyrB [Verrucomicrobiales bacterium]
MMMTWENLAEYIRKRPGMFFGESGPDGLPRFFLFLIKGILSQAPEGYGGPVEVVVSDKGKGQEFRVSFQGLQLLSVAISGLQDLDGHLWKLSQCELSCVPSASSSCVVETSDGEHKTTLRWKSGLPGKPKCVRFEGSSFVKLTLQPEQQIFQTLQHDQIYKMAGILRDYSLLRPQLATVLRSRMLGREIRYFYKEGIKSYLMESDYQRWPLHPGCLHFKRSEGGLSVEGCLRFLHAGSAYVQSYANYHPTQGGTHVEGLAAALKDLFGPEARGCRDVLFLTNPDTGQKVFLPACCIGVVHFQCPEPRYQGPTKDI